MKAGRWTLPPQTKSGRQRSLLEIAVEAGFYSMVEPLAKHESDESSKNAALAQGVSSRRLDQFRAGGHYYTLRSAWPF